MGSDGSIRALFGAQDAAFAGQSNFGRLAN
jgi:hypothetical protein